MAVFKEYNKYKEVVERITLSFYADFPYLQFYKVGFYLGWRTNSKRPASAICHREEKLQAQEKVGKGYESAQGEICTWEMRVGIIRM